MTRNEIAKVLVLLGRQVHVTAKICLFNRLLSSYWLFGYFPVPDSRLVLVHQSVLPASRCCSQLPPAASTARHSNNPLPLPSTTSLNVYRHLRSTACPPTTRLVILRRSLPFRCPHLGNCPSLMVLRPSCLVVPSSTSILSSLYSVVCNCTLRGMSCAKRKKKLLQNN